MGAPFCVFVQGVYYVLRGGGHTHHFFSNPHAERMFTFQVFGEMRARARRLCSICIQTYHPHAIVQFLEFIEWFPFSLRAMIFFENWRVDRLPHRRRCAEELSTARTHRPLQQLFICNRPLVYCCPCFQFSDWLFGEDHTINRFCVTTVRKR